VYHDLLYECNACRKTSLLIEYSQRSKQKSTLSLTRKRRKLKHQNYWKTFRKKKKRNRNLFFSFFKIHFNTLKHSVIIIGNRVLKEIYSIFH
jgi:hypothetical protein